MLKQTNTICILETLALLALFVLVESLLFCIVTGPAGWKNM